MLPGAALREVVDTLTAADLVASTEVGEITFPGIWVVPVRSTHNYLSGSEYEMEIDLYLLTLPNGSSEVIDSLDEMATKVRSVFSFQGAEYMSLPLGTGTEALPGLLITITPTITQD